MNKIGSLYQVKKWYWFLFPNKETAAAASDADAYAPDGALRWQHPTGHAAAVYYSKRFNCNVSYVSPEEIFVLLEVDGKFKKIISTKGDIGWTWFDEHYNGCFEEVTQL